MLIALFAILAECIWLAPFDQFYFYETNWGFLLSTASVIGSIKATRYKEWQTFAVVMNEVAFTMEISVVLIWWGLMFDGDISDHSIFLLNQISIHSLPFLINLANLVLTDIVYLKKDWIILFTFGILYIPANFIGFLSMGHAPYDAFPLDWKYPNLTIFVFCIQAVCLSIVFYWVAGYLQKIHGYHE